MLTKFQVNRWKSGEISGVKAQCQKFQVVAAVHDYNAEQKL